jgi:preprotein translocase subunit SecE
MDVKLRGDAAVKPARARRFFDFVQEIKDELRKVSWTTKEELSFSTKAVISSIFVLGLGIYGVDLIVKTTLDLISFAVTYIFG